MSVPSLESLLAQHAVKYVEIDDVALCMCGQRFHDNTSPNDQREGVMSHSDHLASVIREQWLTAEYIAAGTEGPDMDWTSEDTWATPSDAEEWQRRTQNQGWVERRYVSEWVRLADEAEVQQ
ncbi:hypothetical protein JTZ10_21585 [Gordonia rubripertincta]|uniref:Uncharacterized protein n=1 Tax=Gordonia rubripertincta TaxID=36822 RepID=A0AAW4GB60_GORRU|nr:hypothetical protein [Gordonia rubripertincta]MBM7280340.1 hypothetical protein [Gordonia rubripertincta]